MIPWFKPHYWGNEKRYVMDALDSSWISGGEYIRKFESGFAAVHGVADVVTVSNGTTALYLALLSLNIGPNDEVIIPGYTFAAPANMVIATGATPVFVDVDKDTWLLDPTLIEAKITPKTKAILPVHIYGNVCAMTEINAIAKKHGLYVIEDVAEAAFSTQNANYAGTLGDIGCFSFHATKTLTMGEGGAVIFSDAMLDRRARVIRSHGMTPERTYWHTEVGHNFRLTNMQAAIGVAQLEKLNDIIINKKRVYQRYQANLGNVKGIKMQQMTANTDPVIWAVALCLSPEFSAFSRDELRALLSEKGIETRAGFYPFNEMSIYTAEDLPVTNAVSHHLISLPSYPSLEDDKIDAICDTFITLGMRSYV